MLPYPMEVTSLFSHSNANAVSPWKDYFFVARMATMHGSNLYQDDFRYCYWQTPNSSVAAHSVWSHLSRTLARQLVRGWLYHTLLPYRGQKFFLIGIYTCNHCFWQLNHLQAHGIPGSPTKILYNIYSDQGTQVTFITVYHIWKEGSLIKDK